MEEGDVRAFVEFIYSDKIPSTFSWEERQKEAVAQMGFTPDKEEFKKEAAEYFWKLPNAQAYFSFLQLYNNVCQSLRENEAGNENTSYKTKIENAKKLSDLWKLIESEKKNVFKGDEESEAGFASGKRAATFAKGGADESMERLKKKHEAG